MGSVGSSPVGAVRGPPTRYRPVNEIQSLHSSDLLQQERTPSGGYRGENRVPPNLVFCYVVVMLGLPLTVFFVGAYSTLQQRRSEMAPHRPGPVSYANFVMEGGDQLVEDVETEHVWIQQPRMNESQANAVFASLQFYFEHGKGGYMGTQVWREGVTDQRWGFLFGGRVTHAAIFAIWDADEFHKARAGRDATSAANCGRFGNEGTGSHCSVPYPLEQGRKVTVRVHRAGRSSQHGVSGDLWTGTVLTPETNKVRVIGSLFVEDHEGAHRGYGSLSLWRSTTAFVEYYRANGCDGQAVSQVGLFGPFYANRSITPSQVSPDYNECQRGNFAECIPGFGCGRPRVFLTAGGDTVPVAQKGQNLWVS